MFDKATKFLALTVILAVAVIFGGINRAEAVSMHIPEGASIRNTVNILNLAKKTDGFIEGTTYNGSARSFANKVYGRLFGLRISGYANDNYGAANYEGSHIVGQLFYFNPYNIDAVKNLFWNVKPGAIVQIGRRGNTTSSGLPIPHTAIFFYAANDGSGCTFYEANADGRNTIQVNNYTWAQLAAIYSGFTVYEPNNYPN